MPGRVSINSLTQALFIRRSAISSLLLSLCFLGHATLGQDPTILDAERMRLGYRHDGAEPNHNMTHAVSRDTSLEYLGRWGWGACRGVATMGNYVLTGSGPTMLWLDMTDTHQPVVVWETVADYALSHFIIQDSIGYALAGGYALVIVDLRNPLSPAITAQLPIINFLLSLAVEGGFAFVKRYLGYLYCIDVSDPSAPFIRSVIRQTGAQWGNLSIANSNLYIGDQNGFTEHVDVSNPDSARVTVLHNVAFTLTAVHASDSLLLLGNIRLYIYSITAPAAPAQLSSINIGGAVMSIALHGDTVYAGVINGNIIALDISDRSNPVILGTYTPPVVNPDLYPWYMTVKDTVLYSSYGKNLTTLSVADPAAINVLSAFPTGYESNKVVVRNGHAYVTSGYAGLWVVDVSDPSQPLRVGNIQTTGYAYDLVIDSTVAYVSVNRNGMGVWSIDISQPNSLSVLDIFPTTFPYAISKAGSILFVTHGGNTPDTTLTLLDVSDPSNMNQIGFLSTGHTVREIASRDSIAFIATNAGVKIYDCRHPSSPQFLSSVFSNSFGVSVRDSIAFVHRGDSTFVVDIADVAAPVTIGGVRHPPPNFGGPWKSVLVKDLLFWANGGELGVIDLSNPNEPRSLLEEEVFSRAGIDVVSDTIYFTRADGLWIANYRMEPTFVETGPHAISSSVQLLGNHPNPFNAVTRLRFVAASREAIRIDVYNMLGQHIRSAFRGVAEPGEHNIDFDATGLPSGIYFYRLLSRNTATTGRMVLIK